MLSLVIYIASNFSAMKVRSLGPNFASMSACAFPSAITSSIYPTTPLFLLSYLRIIENGVQFQVVAREAFR
jgi:hypothetical protein